MESYKVVIRTDDIELFTGIFQTRLDANVAILKQLFILNNYSKLMYTTDPQDLIKNLPIVCDHIVAKQTDYKINIDVINSSTN